MGGLALASCAPKGGAAGGDGAATSEGDAPVSPGSVWAAVTASCTTSSVEGLSKQIIEQGVCLTPGAFAAVPALPNLSFEPGVFAYLETPARDALVAALAASPGTALHVNSMLRTVAQQYLVYTWYQRGTCGIGLAAHPGKSNHETGLAFDTDQWSSDQGLLAAHGFKWFGGADPVHFDYAGAGAVSHGGLDVQAFQHLWNLNHPDDPIAEDGAYGPQTEARLRKAPASGFAHGPDCGGDGQGGAGGAAPLGAGGAPAGQGGAGPGADCGAYAGKTQYTCAPDGNGRGRCSGGSLDYEACPRGCLVVEGLDDVCMGSDAQWSCNGPYGTSKMANGDYYGTAFGCWTDGNGNPQSDPGDNCIPACLNAAQQGGLCAGQSGPDCERSVGWFAADAARFGCLARLRVTNPANGKAVVVVALDLGPSCKVEASVSHAAVDLSYPANDYLFGGAQGISDKAAVHVVEVDPATPLGPVQ
jgi:hypothetical protein